MLNNLYWTKLINNCIIVTRFSRCVVVCIYPKSSFTIIPEVALREEIGNEVL